MLRETNDTVLMATQYVGTFAFGAVTAPFAWVTPTLYDLTFLSGFGVVSIARCSASTARSSSRPRVSWCRISIR